MELAIRIQGHESCSEEGCIVKGPQRCCTIGTSKCEPSFAIEDYYVYTVKNVSAVGVFPRNLYGWDVRYSPESAETPTSFYFCIDGIYHEAWSHWVDESAIYLPLYLKLKNLFPGIKLYSFGKKGYKTAMYRAFGIDLEDVVYTIDDTSNEFMFPRYISLGDHRQPYLFYKHAQVFYKSLVAKLPEPEKDIDILYLPRGTKENCKQNDRQIPMQPYLIQVLSQFPNAQVFFTDKVENMLEQWALLRRAKVIILNEGSSLLVNGYFSVNSKIISLGGHGNQAHLWNPCPALLFYDSIRRGNSYYTLPYEAPVNYVLGFVFHVLEGKIHSDPIPPFKCYKNCSYCKYQQIENACF